MTNLFPLEMSSNKFLIKRKKKVAFSKKVRSAEMHEIQHHKVCNTVQFLFESQTS